MKRDTNKDFADFVTLNNTELERAYIDLHKDDYLLFCASQFEVAYKEPMVRTP